jgi:microcystin-dependent protein
MMVTPYIGEIRMFGGNFAPHDWALCNGQLLPIPQYEALYSLIGTTYGGDGVQNFGLPNLQSRVPVHQGPGFVLGQMAGEETVTLNTNQLPAHTHVPMANTTGTAQSPAQNMWANSGNTVLMQYTATNTENANMNAATVQATGGGQAHDNMLPYQAINFIIALFGIFPPQN